MTIWFIYHRNHEPEARKVIDGLKEAYEIKDQGAAEWYLRVCIIRDRAAGRLYLVHDSYIEKIAKRFEATEAGQGFLGAGRLDFIYGYYDSSRRSLLGRSTLAPLAQPGTGASEGS
jgi:hypothetical protein